MLLLLLMMMMMNNEDSSPKPSQAKPVHCSIYPSLSCSLFTLTLPPLVKKHSYMRKSRQGNPKSTVSS
jgi:hypothetical protein